MSFDFDARADASDAASAAASAAADPLAGFRQDLEDRVVAAMRTVFDPEIPVNIVDLGLIYGLEVTNEGQVAISMTLTSPNCPEAQTLPDALEDAVVGLDDVTGCTVEVTFFPPWTPDRMTEEARLELNLL